MGSISTLNLNYSAVVNRKIAMSTKVYLPEGFTSTLMNSKKLHVSPDYQVLNYKQVSIVMETRVASLDVPLVPEKDDSTEEAVAAIVKDNKIEDAIQYIKSLLSTTGDGRISVSPYDTAWVALIRNADGSDTPQFPTSLDWIAQNQLSDGSWGDEKFFCAYDRLLNTLACVVALRSWNIHPDKSQKGISYIKENVYKLEDAKAEHRTCGFEVIFPALLQKAINMGIDDIPYDASVIRQIYNVREEKLKRIPMEMMHKVPTSLLFSLEGLENLNWQKLLKLQAVDGSFLTSPSSTAFAFMETKDEKCFEFIKKTVEKFNGGAPHTYPVDVFGRLWAVDRLQRLGISRFFESEIESCLNYIYCVWTDKGVFSGRDSEFCDIDDTSMGFRLLRLQGHDVDPNVFKNFKNDNKFSCYGGQIIESPSPIYNLYRASQIRFPGEKILEEAEQFAYNFLQEKLESNQILDKWIISKHLPDEIKIGLEMPWYSSLPRVLTRFYLEHYGAADDVWIGKTLYRMPEISNDTYMELARLDYNRCQTQHQIEWLYMQKWYGNYNIQEFGITRKELLRAYFLATATIFEPERSKERTAWAKFKIISKMITSFFNEETTIWDHKNALLTAVRNNINGPWKTKSTKSEHGLLNNLLATLDQLLHGFDKHTRHQLKNAWVVWLTKLHDEEDNYSEAELLATTLNICAGHIPYKEDILFHHEYKTLSSLTNKICRQLQLIHNKKVLGNEDWETAKSSLKNVEFKQDMQTLVKFALEETGGIHRSIKQTFFSVVKTFYYGAYNADEIIDMHIYKVLFEPVV
ncbi:Copal-8-ol diphosphate hydratase [Handroanthus impetiginosus]|uniref:Copal-8-ol diphosphate hydratase n=1 Tax=Handroanthus impetiginosus TaxID=429701 RepID=A0A2G9HK45_9LAMI|nr:Copal-8-ol diphosphate hydratase [Handroanthus impetiginosus]